MSTITFSAMVTCRHCDNGALADGSTCPVCLGNPDQEVVRYPSENGQLVSMLAKDYDRAKVAGIFPDHRDIDTLIMGAK